MTTHTDPSPILVAGGTGKTGRRVADLLTSLGHPVRIGSRGAPTPLDWTDPTTFAPALTGARCAYAAYSPDMAFAGAVDHIAAFVTAAEQAGVQRIVLLSGRGEPSAEAAEQLALSSAVDATVVRCSFFAQNFTESFLYHAVCHGVIALPAGGVAEPVIDADDIAAVAVRALTEPGHTGLVYELTGPELLTFADMAAELSSVTGGVIGYVPVTPDEFADAAIAAGVPAGEAHALGELLGFVFDGHNASLTSTVADILGRPARSFGDFAREHAAAGTWNSPSTSVQP